ncbi:hypothetical protein E2C01_054714 [Portunus trituberculatus]|uniref:Uncharacterized protein n=1 Tax=Portunus trituberculatus TaxID=210409 RepID=A0A5B7GUN9_PORTR|nr:hypothetical protein [Portunus trituberculatus]
MEDNENKVRKISKTQNRLKMDQDQQKVNLKKITQKNWLRERNKRLPKW